jgi:hypothetical protein
MRYLKDSIVGWKAWPRRLRRLRCSLDFTRDDKIVGQAHRLPFEYWQGGTVALQHMFVRGSNPR